MDANKYLEQIEEKIGENQQLTIKTNNSMLEGRHITAEWVRADAEQMRREGKPSQVRLVHGFWMEEVLRKVIHIEEEQEDAWARMDEQKAQEERT